MLQVYLIIQFIEAVTVHLHLHPRFHTKFFHQISFQIYHLDLSDL